MYCIENSNEKICGTVARILLLIMLISACWVFICGCLSGLVERSRSADWEKSAQSHSAFSLSFFFVENNTLFYLKTLENVFYKKVFSSITQKWVQSTASDLMPSVGFWEDWRVSPSIIYNLK